MACATDGAILIPSIGMSKYDVKNKHQELRYWNYLYFRGPFRVRKGETISALLIITNFHFSLV